MFNETDIIKIIKSNVQEALAPAILEISERQAKTEASTCKQFENLQGLLEALSSLIGLTSGTRQNNHEPFTQFPCHTCGQTLKTLDSLDNHIREYHPTLLCLKCGKTTRSVPDLNYHNHKYHPIMNDDGNSSTAQMCHSCDYTCRCPEDMNTHFANHHDDNSFYSCAMCNSTFPTFTKFKEHLKSEHSVGSPVLCSICDNIFLNETELQSHTDCHIATPCIGSNESSPNYYSSSNLLETNPMMLATPDIPLVFTSTAPYSAGIDQPGIHCKYCDKIFQDIRAVNQHTHYNHSVQLVYQDRTSKPAAISESEGDKTAYDCSHPNVCCFACWMCDRAFFRYDELNAHMQTHGHQINHALIGPYSPERITQLDGADDHSFDSDGTLTPTSAPGRHSVSSLVTSYTLNQRKQLLGLAKNAKLVDFEILMNDNGRNLNIQCSTGFYEAVAKPSFSGLSTGYHNQVDSIFVECTEIRSLLDMASSLPGSLLKFKLYGPGVSPSPASLSVHLHHTQQKVQVQGGARLPDNMTAAAWFVHKVIKDIFITAAKTKKFDVENINRVVGNMITNQEYSPPSIPACCPHCNKKFTANSKPVICPRCSEYRHKGKCSSYCPSTSAVSSTSSSTHCALPSLSNPSLTTSTIPGNISEDSQPSSKRFRHSDDIPPTSVSTSPLVVAPTVAMLPLPAILTTASSAPALIHSQPTTRSLMTRTTTATSLSVSTREVAAGLANTNTSASSNMTNSSHSSLFVPSSLASIAPLVTSQTTSASSTMNPQRKRKSNLKEATKSPEQSEIDFLKLELNSVRTHVLELETDKADLERKISVMNDVIKMHQQRQTTRTFENDFPDLAQPSNTRQQQSVDSQCHHGSHHLPAYHVCSYANNKCWLFHNCCCHSQKSSFSSSTDPHDDLKSVVKNMQDDIVDIVNKIDKISTNKGQVIKETAPKNKPFFRNPTEIPNYDRIDVVVEADVHVDSQDDHSIVSCDEFVPDVAPDQDTDHTQTISLN